MMLNGINKHDVGNKLRQLETGTVVMMSRLFRKSISLAMFVIFMANSGVWNFQTNWLAHEIDHSTKLAQLTLTTSHADAHHCHAEASCDEASPGAAEHKLMHAADHLQLFPGTIVSIKFSLSHNPVLPDFSQPDVPLALSESPFRPPKSTLS